MIRILLVEPMNLLRGALAATLSLEKDFEVVADLGGLDQALDMARAVPPDVAVVNVGLLADDGVRTIDQLASEQPRCATLVLAGPEAPGLLNRALDVHVRGVIGTQAAPCELVRSICVCGVRGQKSSGVGRVVQGGARSDSEIHDKPE